MISYASNPKENFNRLYSDVSTSIANATVQIDKLEVEHQNGKQELGNILERLRGIQTRFDKDLGLLEEHAEWERFTIAFFGETNAGKSTIIESLRILFDEESRRQLLDQNTRDLSSYEEALTHQVEAMRLGLLHAHAAYVADIAAVRHDIETQTNVILNESTARTTTFRQEVTALETCLQEESSSRRQLQEQLELVQNDGISANNRFDDALAKAKRKIWIAALVGCIFGGSVLGVITSFWK